MHDAGVSSKHRQRRLHRRPDPVADAFARLVRLVANALVRVPLLDLVLKIHR